MREEVRLLKASSINMLPKDRAISAGTKPVPKINPMAVEVMKEVGIDISNQISRHHRRFNS